MISLIKFAYQNSFYQFNFSSIFTALFICFVWIVFLERIKPNNMKKFLWSGIPLVLGALFGYITIMISGVFIDKTPLINDYWLIRLLWTVLTVGAVEEIAKLFPVILLVMFFWKVQDPYELLLMGSFSALGFATLENAIYFSKFGLTIVYSRFWFSTIVHLVLTSLICYIWARVFHSFKKNQILALLFGLAIASFIHGVYDYLIYTPSSLVVGNIILTVVLVRIYFQQIRDLLSKSFQIGNIRLNKEIISIDLFIFASLALITIVSFDSKFNTLQEPINNLIGKTFLFSLPVVSVTLSSLGYIKIAYQACPIGEGENLLML